MSEPVNFNRLEPELEDAERRRRAKVSARLRSGGQSFSFSRPASLVFRELSADIQMGSFPSLSYSQLIELLVAHWRKTGPTYQWCCDFYDTKMKTKRGRPRVKP